jgi:aryl-alcohol dehydrogenase-like predicted oxidoreductase
VHNLGDVPTQLAILKELKQQGASATFGVTTTFDQQYGQIVEIMRREPLDFIGIDYAIDAREARTRSWPVAQERKIAVLSYQPFGRTRLWNRVGSSAGPRVCRRSSTPPPGLSSSSSSSPAIRPSR